MKRIFIAFAIEDKFARDNLVFQSNQAHTPFEFIDMSVKEPFSEAWKTQCRVLIKSCDGVVAFISRNTPEADGELWEIKCAIEEGIPIRGFWVHRDDPCCRPSEMGSTQIDFWTWETVKSFIDSV